MVDSKVGDRKSADGCENVLATGASGGFFGGLLKFMRPEHVGFQPFFGINVYPVTGPSPESPKSVPLALLVQPCPSMCGQSARATLVKCFLAARRFTPDLTRG